MFFWLCLLQILIFSVTAYSQDSVELGEVTVEGMAETPERAIYPSSVRVFEKKDFKDSSLNVANWLGRESGLHLSRIGDDTSASTVSIRGSTSDQVTIYLNGIPLNPAAGGGVNLSQLSLHQVERIKIYKGRVPLSLGGDPIGGAIFIESARARAGRNANALFRYGSFGTVEGFANYSESHPHFSIDTSYNGTRTDGDFSFLDDNGTPANPTDDAVIARQNNQATEHDGRLTLAWTPTPSQTVEFFQRFYREDRGVPGLGSFQSASADLSDTQSLSALSWRAKSLFHSRWNYAQKHSFLFAKSQFADPNAEIGLGNPQDNDDRTLHYTHQELLDWDYRPTGVLHFLFGYDWENYFPRDFAHTPTDGPSDTRHRLQGGAEIEDSFFKDRLLLSASASYQHFRNAFNDADPSTTTASDFTNTDTENTWTASGQIDITVIRDWLSLDAEMSRAVRPPHFYELFGDRGSVIGNPRLQSEKGWNVSGGFRLSHTFTKSALNSFFVSSDYFERNSTDLIQFAQSGTVAQASNVGKSRARGWEIDAQVSLFHCLDLESNFTLARVENTLTDKDIPGHPRRTFFGQATFHRTLGPGELKVYGNWHYEEGRYLDFSNFRRVTHEDQIDAGASYRFAKGYRLFFDARNLSNSQLVDVVGFPLPGRAFYGGVEWEFKSTPHPTLSLKGRGSNSF